MSAKFYAFAIILALFASSCAGMFSAKTRSYATPKAVLLTKNSPPVFRNMADPDSKDSAGVLPKNVGDTVYVLGRVTRSSPVLDRFIYHDGKDSLWLDDAATIDRMIYLLTGKKFQVKKDEDPACWARATVFVTKHSDMKIQTASDNIIQTYNPIDGAKKGFLVTRVPMGDMVEYEITCFSPNMFVNTYQYACEMGFYMKTGREYFDY